MGFDALSDRSKSVERARRRRSHGTEIPQEARVGSHQDRAGRTCRRITFTQAKNLYAAAILIRQAPAEIRQASTE